ncbi:polysaccharide deacetylase family protein [Sulfurimonas sp. C5]|uniref:polysaccharide deacetylase family protein n=1 Tax=Sulfurimonas sp. C5 TaxID=3036947 RepID=UPI0024575C8C|nr:polysaccharide deacetylase family protein [Sulfurimonas sp. C5]MDH4944185.1 polysaccharide deacetylase family protein [Sulfurimonas sp. C5]
MKKIILLIFIVFSTFADEHAVVFMYHHFGNEKYPSTNVTKEQFQAQLDYLFKNNYNVVKLSTVINLLKQNKPLPPKTVVLTIDDAYKSVYTVAFKMLKRYKYQCTVFVNTHAVDVGSKFYMSWDEMREMQKYGIEFSNHSYSHPYLLQKKDLLNKEIQYAQKRLQEELGKHTNENPKMFSYPFGEYDEELQNYLEKNSYVGITQTSGVLYKGNLNHVPRYPMAERYAALEEFALKLNTLPLPINSIQEYMTNNPPTLQIKLKKHMGIRCYLSSGEPIDVKWLDDTTFQTKSKEKIRFRREKYTCTAEAENDKWYWYSHLWIFKD